MMDSDDSAPAFDVESGLSRLRGRLTAVEEVQERTIFEKLRWALVPAAAATAAAVAIAVYLGGPFQEAGKPPPQQGTHKVAVDNGDLQQPAGPGDVEQPPSGSMIELVDLLEEFPLYENLDCFQEYETLAALIEVDEQVWDELLKEVEG